MTPFEKLALPVDRPHRLFLRHPVTNAPLVAADEAKTPAYLDLLCTESRANREYNDAVRDKRLRDRTARPLTSDELRAENVERLARLTKGWLLVVPGSGETIDVPCTLDAARAIYAGEGTGWLFEQAEAFVTDRAAFFAAPPSS